MRQPKIYLILGLILTIPLLFLGGVRLYRSICFEIECGGHLKRAADANSVELAIQELTTSLKYCESHHMIEGYTSVLYNSPSEDVGFWYSNLKVSLDNLKKLDPKASSLETSTTLLKLRQTLLDHTGEGGEKPTIPAGISVFPANRDWMFITIATIISALLGAILVGSWLFDD